MRAAFRVDASAALGIGHVMRCRRLAAGLRHAGASVRFVTRPLAAVMAREIEREGIEHVTIPERDSAAGDAEETRRALADAAWDWVIVDHYGLDASWERSVRDVARHVLAIDDLADRLHDCDVLLDQNLYLDAEARYDGKVPAGSVRLTGPKYALLDASFLAERGRARVRSGPVERLLICFGGGDAGDHTGRAIDALRRLRTVPAHVDVVIGAAHPRIDAITATCAARGYALQIQSNDLARLMAAADLGIGAGGSMTWERCAVGLPALVFVTADNQRQVVADGAATGILYAPASDDAIEEVIARHLDALIDNAPLRSLISSNAMRAVDARGVSRVVRAMGAGTMQVREAGIGDARALFEWRNAPEVRAASHGGDAIEWAAHERWVARVVADPDRVLLIGVRDGADIGVVRFDMSAADAEVSIYLSPGPHPPGTGIDLLLAAEAWLAERRPVARMRASVRAHNARSHGLFASAGYRPESTIYCKTVNPR